MGGAHLTTEALAARAMTIRWVGDAVACGLNVPAAMLSGHHSERMCEALLSKVIPRLYQVNGTVISCENEDQLLLESAGL